MKKLKSYNINQKKQIEIQDIKEERKLVSSGIACTEKICSICKKPHRMKDRPLIIGKTREEIKKSITNLKAWNKKHSQNLIPCPGEMMILYPNEKHPELTELKRAKCSLCGWKGWV
jgi:hypothetical protein